MPDELLRLLTPREHMLLHALLSHRWFADSEIYPSVGRLALMLGWSDRTVQRTMRGLESDGYVVRVARYRDETEHADGGQTSNRYEPGPMLLPLLPPADDRPVTGGRRPQQGRATGRPYERRHRNYTTPSVPRLNGFMETRYGTYVPRST